MPWILQTSPKGPMCKANSSQQLVPNNTQHSTPTHTSFQSPGQDRSWWAQSGPGYKKTMSADLVMRIYPGAENKGKATGFSGSQRQPASHPSHGKTFLLFPSAVHTIMPLTR